MDITRTEALIARMKRDGWDITSNAYKYDFPGTYVMAGSETGNIYVDRGVPSLTLDVARRITAYLEGIPGIEDVVMDGQKRNGDITIRFRCADFTGNWART